MHVLLQNGSQLLLTNLNVPDSDQTIKVDTSFQVATEDNSFEESQPDYKGTIEVKVTTLRVKKTGLSNQLQAALAFPEKFS